MMRAVRGRRHHFVFSGTNFSEWWICNLQSLHLARTLSDREGAGRLGPEGVWRLHPRSWVRCRCLGVRGTDRS